ncbi:MAG: hypothetical protein A2275_13705 [Bacteroidetes bacterium RIFOXYA12_FULL_35_11]|nr:MAG: hypothetical protein A2X01_13380 [Bacteroidetes bacterium GWF2_35_48]OFY80371.1 MAG: hypothetical protein A2275_13705 [Bacteroidetes bacterium RIFOXYA12_FULL_35_11]OFY97231.1 MAG: hypothetical protein A2491_17645 [Bacteroidetes bacterium RIFOXYC12_FULL_35_7]HBX50761.1 hypothetical protein [Bacteroidales bacterium]
MKYHRYEYSTEKDLYFFEFESIGIKGKIKKIVQYSEMSVKGFYNLGFGDYNEITKEIDDEIITNNGDGLKVLATVVSTLYSFTGKYPEANIFATGNNEARTRLYRMGITNYLEELKQDFLVYGLRKDEIFEEFIVGEDYMGFLVTRKNKDIKI